jgi:hypothetical protein
LIRSSLDVMVPAPRLERAEPSAMSAQIQALVFGITRHAIKNLLAPVRNGETAWHLFVDTLASFQEDQRSAMVKDRFATKAVVQTKDKNHRSKA